jgi:hypothetical protein
MDGACGTNERGNTYGVVVGTHGGSRPLRGHRLLWGNNIKMHLNVIEWEGEDWIIRAQDRDRWWDFVRMVSRLGGISACPVDCCLPLNGRHLGLLTAHDQ